MEVITLPTMPAENALFCFSIQLMSTAVRVPIISYEIFSVMLTEI